MTRMLKYLLILGLAFAPAAAVAKDNAAYRNYLSFSVENDSLGDGNDAHYTSGVRASWFNTGTQVPEFVHNMADALPIFDINETTSTLFTVGQNLYTPEDISLRGPQPRDRPWAGFLYGSLGLVTRTGMHIDELEATLGVIGPEAMGEQSQKFIHRHLTGSPTPRGWSNQLDFEPGLILSWQRRWPQALYADLGDFRLAVEPNVNLSVGNVYTYAGTGAVVTFGPYQGMLQDTPPRVRPATPGTGFFQVPNQEWGWYVFASADGRAVGRNIFLDGNTFGDSPSVEKKPFVADLSGGLAFTLLDYRLSYALTYRTKEFDGQDSEALFGSLSLTARF